MLATSMKTAVEGILSSREARKSALQGIKEDGQTALKGYREALAAMVARQRSALKAGRAKLRAEMQRSLAPMRADLTQARMEWQRTGQGQPMAEHVGTRDFISPPGKAHHQRARSKA